MATENFFSQDPENQQHYQELVNELKALVQGWENAGQAGKGGK